jgi:mono/diheme cytochrome c family protein
MRRLKKIATCIAIILLVVIGSISVIVATRQNLHFDAPYPDIKSSTDPLMIARGRHLVTGAAHCVNCHSVANVDSIIDAGLEVPLSGGVVFKLPLGNIYSRNITPDLETGIGGYTDAQIARALRYGVRHDGSALFDFMAFHNTSDEDLAAILSYLRAQRPVKSVVPKHELNAIGKAVKAFLVTPVGPVGNVPEKMMVDSSVLYGQYLSTSVAECSGCHTQRSISGAFIGTPFAGGEAMGEGVEALYPPNLTTDSSSRIFGWTQDMFINRFRQGKLIQHSHMPWEAYKRMSNVELVAIYKFLQSLPASKNPITALAKNN